MTLIIGVILALSVILLDLKFVSLGLKNIDPLTDHKFIFRYAIPLLLLELAFIFWVYFNLPTGILLAIVILSFSGMILKALKTEGHKFYIYVLIPISEIIIIVFAMTKHILKL